MAPYSLSKGLCTPNFKFVVPYWRAGTQPYAIIDYFPLSGTKNFSSFKWKVKNATLTENKVKAIKEKRQLSVSYSVPVSADLADTFFYVCIASG